MMKRILIAAFAAALGLEAQDSAAQTARSASSGQGVSASEILASVNAYRSSYGLQPVRVDAAVTRAARAQSAAMAQQGVMSHDAGGDFRARLLANGVGRAPAVENIAWGTPSFSATMQMWMSSSKHAENMQTPDMTRVGVAVVNGSNGPYWTMVMAGNAR